MIGLKIGVSAVLVAMLALFAASVPAPAANLMAADESGQKPPAAADKQECVVDSANFKLDGKTPTFVVALENKCETHLRCKVYATVMSAKGNAQGHATLTLAPHAQGARAKQSYVLKVKMMGGIAQAGRECKAL
jgi:hypothetical protein